MNLKSSPANSLVNLNRFKVVNLTGICNQCKDEADFIKKSKQLIKQMLKYNMANIDDMFFGEPPTKKDFHNALNKIL